MAKTPKIWIARDQKVGTPDTHDEDDAFWAFSRKPNVDRVFLSKRREFSPVTASYCHQISELFMEDMGFELEPGQCKEFRLVEVKR